MTWSHVLAFVGEIRRTTVVILGLSGLAIFAVMAWAAGTVRGAVSGALGMAGTLAILVFLFGPLAMRYDLRRDLARLEILRAYPIDPRWLVAAEVAGPVLMLTVLELAFLALAGALLPFSGASPDVIVLAVPFGLLLAVNTPGLLALQVLIQNTAALLFPGWVRIGAAPAGGVDAVGQGILVTLGSLLAFGLLLLPPAILAVAVGAAYGAALGPWSAVPAAVTFTGAVWAEVVWLTRRLAARFERLDPVEAGLLT